MAAPSESNHYLKEHTNLLVSSYQRQTGKVLFAENLNAEIIAKELFFAPFAVASHNTNADPIFNYANLKALELFEFDWDEFMQLPSRFSAEPINQAERERLLVQVNQHGYIDDYEGVRISKHGRRFLIKNACVWNVVDHDGCYRGQAVIIRHWNWL